MAASTSITAAPEAGTVRAFRRVPGLDGLRGLAVLVVFGLHWGKLAGHPTFMSGGFAGVDVFFVLSGFLITSLLLGERDAHGAVSFRDFYIRRACRLLPALAVVVVAHIIYTLATDAPRGIEAKAVVSIALYVGNFVQAHLGRFPGGLGQTWSLSVEEQFYLLWPLALMALMRARANPRTLVAVAIGGAAVSAVLRAIAFHSGAAGYAAALMLPWFHFDGLLLGVACAFAWRWGVVGERGWGAPAWAGVAGLLAITFLVASNSKYGFYVFYAASSVCAAAILLAIVSGGWSGRAVFEFAPLRWLGMVSYGLYLWHPFVMRVIAEKVDAAPLTRALISVPASLAITWLSWRLVEQPFLRLKDRVAPRAAAPTAA